MSEKCMGSLITSTFKKLNIEAGGGLANVIYKEYFSAKKEGRPKKFENIAIGCIYIEGYMGRLCHRPNYHKFTQRQLSDLVNKSRKSIGKYSRELWLTIGNEKMNDLIVRQGWKE